MVRHIFFDMIGDGDGDGDGDDIDGLICPKKVIQLIQING